MAAVKPVTIAVMLLVALLLGGCTPSGSPGPEGSPTAAPSEEGPIERPNLSVKEHVVGRVMYVEYTSHGATAFKVETPTGNRILFIDVETAGKPASRVKYQLGGTYDFGVTEDPLAPGEYLVLEATPVTARDPSVPSALGVVTQLYNHVYRYKLDTAYGYLSNAYRNRMDIYSWKAQWPGDSLQPETAQSFTPRRLALEWFEAGRTAGVLADITRLFKKGDPRVVRLRLVWENGNWRVDRIEKANPKDFLSPISAPR